MHPLCYINLSNIEVDQPPPSEYMLMLEDLILQVPTASHARIDEIYKSIFNIRFATKRRNVLVSRRAELISTLQRRIASQARALHYQARKAAFIGPLTIQQRNGHPF